MRVEIKGSETVATILAWELLWGDNREVRLGFNTPYSGRLKRADWRGACTVCGSQPCVAASLLVFDKTIQELVNPCGEQYILAFKARA